MRSVLDGIASRLDEQREVSRYMIGLLIFLGLLGTFWGLLLTIGSISDVIGNMSVGSGDVNQLFNQLKAGWRSRCAAWARPSPPPCSASPARWCWASSTSAPGQAQTRFFNELEEWLAGITRLSSGVLGRRARRRQRAGLRPGAAGADRREPGSAAAHPGARRGVAPATTQALNTLTERLAVLADQMRAGQSLMMRVAEQQSALGPGLAALADAQARGGLDEQSRAHLRNTELYLARLLEEVAQGRAQSTAEIRNEIKVLARTIAAIAEEAPR
jgi:hypothetical protein